MRLIEPTSRRAFVTIVIASTALSGFWGCDKSEEQAKQKASQVAAELVPTVERDLKQIRDGMPPGSKKLGELLAKEPDAGPDRWQQTIAATRNAVDDLAFAKGTFFAITDPKGKVLRSEADPDRLVDKNVLAAFPELKSALGEKAGLVETYGEMAEIRGVRKGPDVAWVVAHAIPGETPKEPPVGLFVTGWSFRAYAKYLEDAAKLKLTDEAKEADGTVPLIYVFVVKGATAYGAPVTPDVNAEAVSGLNIVEKTKNGPFQGTVEITKRAFGVGAQALPGLGDDAAVVVLLSLI